MKRKTKQDAPVWMETNDDLDQWTSLSCRVQEVGFLLALGLSHKEIAAGLHISEATVGSHAIHIYRTMDVHHAMDLARVLIRTGMMTLETWLEGVAQ